MIFDTSKPIQKQKAILRFNDLLEKEAKIDLTQKREGRTISQNSYLHLCLVQYAIAYGDTMFYVKQEVWKKQICPNIFKETVTNRITGEVREGYRSSSNLDTKEMTTAIDMLRDSASKDLKTYISTPKDLSWIDEVKNLEEEFKQYL